MQRCVVASSIVTSDPIVDLNFYLFSLVWLDWRIRIIRKSTCGNAPSIPHGNLVGGLFEVSANFLLALIED